MSGLLLSVLLAAEVSSAAPAAPAPANPAPAAPAPANPAPAAAATPILTGLTHPESVAVAPDGRIFVTVIGEFDKLGDGAVLRIDGDKAVPFVAGLDDPKGIAAFKDQLFVADRQRVLRIDKTGKATVFADAKAFPRPPTFLNDVAVDPKGTVFVSDSGDRNTGGGAIFAISVAGKVTLVADEASTPAVRCPNGVALDGETHLLVVDLVSGELNRIRLADRAVEKLADGLGRGDGIAFDHHGQLFVTDVKGGTVWGIARPGQPPVKVLTGLQSAADLCFDPSGQRLLIPDLRGGVVVATPATIPGAEVDKTPLALEAELAFPKLKWTGWAPLDDADRPTPLRPIVLTHASDGSHRIFVATQHGVVHVFAADPAVERTEVFLDISAKVRYADKTNEEGLLGLAFHPRFKETGEFFVCYTIRTVPLTNVISRFRVSRDNPNRADPASEEEIFRVSRPFWNHDGGTLAFGPDGYLYVALGDGGAANDPFDNAQNLKTLLGTILRIDVNGRSAGKKYAIPADNPFVGRADAQPEIWAYGLRNVWRMSFDRATGQLWAADVGQNLFEEINLITRGGNYGWNRREGFHPFGAKGRGVSSDFAEPIWEYHHDIGKSITGGHVYRGKRLPELEGLYLYADYVVGTLWALKYDADAKRVVANRTIGSKKFAVISFGEDEAGEVYFLIVTVNGQGIYRFAAAK